MLGVSLSTEPPLEADSSLGFLWTAFPRLHVSPIVMLARVRSDPQWHRPPLQNHHLLRELNIVLESKVYLVDDDHAVRKSLVWMLNQEGIQVEPYASPRDLLNAYDPAATGCLVLDQRLPEMSGLELRARLAERGCQLPFIMITAYGEITDATQAMRMGAIDFIEKPFPPELFLKRIRQALDEDAERCRRQTDAGSFESRLMSLTPRQREVLDLVVSGKMTKQIAIELDISVKTVEVHRRNLKKKLHADSVAHLVRMVTSRSS